MANRIVHFEIHADNPKRAAKFYGDIFGWEIKKWENPGMEYWMVLTAPQGSTEPGISGGLLKRAPCTEQESKEGHASKIVNAFVCTVQVDDIDETIKKIEAAGGILALPKFDIANMAWQAYYKDLEGNIFGIHQVIKQDK